MTRSIRLPVHQIATLAFLLALTAMLSACNTVAGAGEDVQAGGRAIQRTVR